MATLLRETEMGGKTKIIRKCFKRIKFRYLSERKYVFSLFEAFGIRCMYGIEVRGMFYNIK
jgi:hypothetical protein